MILINRLMRNVSGDLFEVKVKELSRANNVNVQEKRMLGGDFVGEMD